MKKLLILFLLILPVNLYAATLEVGVGKTYSTIQSAVNAAQPGDTVLVYAGTYTTTSTDDFGDLTLIKTVRSGSSGNLITIKAAESGVVLDGQNNSDVNSCIHIHNHSYIVIDGFECKQTNLNTSHYNTTGAIYMQDGSNVIVKNCYIHDNTANDYENKAAICVNGTKNALIENNNIKADSIGISGAYCAGSIFRGNTIDGSGNYTYSGQPYHANGMYLSQSCNDVIVEKNYVHDFAWVGIQLRDSERMIVRYNVVYKAHGLWNSDMIFGIYLRDWPYTGSPIDSNDQFQVYNNVVDLSYTGSGEKYGIGMLMHDGTVFKNNIIQNVEYAFSDMGLETGQDSENITFVYNIMNYSTGWVLEAGGGGMTYTKSNNQENVTIKFIAAGNRPSPYYKLQSGSPAIDAGDPSFNVPVSWGIIDIGRYEWTSTGSMPGSPDVK